MGCVRHQYGRDDEADDERHDAPPAAGERGARPRIGHLRRRLALIRITHLLLPRLSSESLRHFYSAARPNTFKRDVEEIRAGAAPCAGHGDATDHARPRRRRIPAIRGGTKQRSALVSGFFQGEGDRAIERERGSGPPGSLKRVIAKVLSYSAELLVQCSLFEGGNGAGELLTQRAGRC